MREWPYRIAPFQHISNPSSQSCGHKFKVDVFEHRENVVLDLVEALDSSSDSHGDDTSSHGYLRRWIRKFALALGVRQTSIRDTVLPLTKNRSIDLTENVTQPSSELRPPEPERYICVCFPGMTYKKYLHHVDVNKARTDPELFVALQQKYFDWKPLWKRIFTLRSLARVEYFEVSDAYSYVASYFSYGVSHVLCGSSKSSTATLSPSTKTGETASLTTTFPANGLTTHPLKITLHTSSTTY